MTSESAQELVTGILAQKGGNNSGVNQEKLADFKSQLQKASAIMRASTASSRGKSSGVISEGENLSRATSVLEDVAPPVEENDDAPAVVRPDEKQDTVADISDSANEKPDPSTEPAVTKRAMFNSQVSYMENSSDGGGNNSDEASREVAFATDVKERRHTGFVTADSLPALPQDDVNDDEEGAEGDVPKRRATGFVRSSAVDAADEAEDSASNGNTDTRVVRETSRKTAPHTASVHATSHSIVTDRSSCPPYVPGRETMMPTVFERPKSDSDEEEDGSDGEGGGKWCSRIVRSKFR